MAQLIICALLLVSKVVADTTVCNSGSDDQDVKRGPAMLQTRSLAKPLIHTTPVNSGIARSDSYVDTLREKVDGHAQLVRLRNLAQRARGLKRVGDAVEQAGRELSAALNETTSAAEGVDTGVDNLMDEFMKDQSNSQDKCPRYLMDGKTRMDDLRVEMKKLAEDINRTRPKVREGNKKIEALEATQSENARKCADEFDQCAELHKDYDAQWMNLQWQLDVMKKLAHPETVVHLKDLNYDDWAKVHGPTAAGDENSKEDAVQWSKIPYRGSEAEEPKIWPSDSSSLQLDTNAVPKKAVHHTPRNTSNAGAPTVVPGKDEVEAAAALVSDVQKASQDLEECRNHENEPLSDACKKLLENFENKFTDGFKEVTRLLSEYELLVNSTACYDKVKNRCDQESADLRLDLDKALEIFDTETVNLVNFEDRLAVLSDRELSQDTYMGDLDKACADMNEEVVGLEDVREALQNLSAKNLSKILTRVNFHIPQYTGYTVQGSFNTLTMNDRELDDAMNKLCKQYGTEGKPARAAETSEIMQQSLQDGPVVDSNPSQTAPVKNPSARVPLWGTCPHCSGDQDKRDGPEVHKSGHFRRCWDGGAVLDGHTMRSDCGGKSFKMVMCVWDKSLRALQPVEPAQTLDLPPAPVEKTPSVGK